MKKNKVYLPLVPTEMSKCNTTKTITVSEHVQEWSHVRGILAVSEKTPRKQHQESCDHNFSKTDLFLGCAFVLLPGVSDRTERTSAVTIHLPQWKTQF